MPVYLAFQTPERRATVQYASTSNYLILIAVFNYRDFRELITDEYRARRIAHRLAFILSIARSSSRRAYVSSRGSKYESYVRARFGKKEALARIFEESRGVKERRGGFGSVRRPRAWQWHNQDILSC